MESRLGSRQRRESTWLEQCFAVCLCGGRAGKAYLSPSADLSSKDYKQDDLVSSSIGVRFGSRLRELRKNRGWTQVRTAEELGIDRSYISDMERGKNRSVCR